MSAAQTADHDATVQVPRGHYEGMQSQIARLTQDYAELKAQLEWFKRQMFGAKSEKRHDPSPEQIALFNALAAELLAAAAQRELPQLDEKLYLEVFSQPAAPAPRRAPARR